MGRISQVEMSILKLTEDLDRVYSKYIRLRDSDDNGWGVCCTCGVKIHWKEAHCGHFFSRKYRATRWYDLNTFLQCPECNMVHVGREKEYRSFLIDRYGEEFISWLKTLSRSTAKLPKQWYEEQIEYRTKLVELLEKIKRMGGKTPADLYQWAP